MVCRNLRDGTDIPEKVCPKNGKETVCFDPTANKSDPITEEDRQTIEQFRPQRRENYQYIIEHITLSWSASDKNGNSIGGIIEPDTLDVDSEQIIYKLGKKMAAKTGVSSHFHGSCGG